MSPSDQERQALCDLMHAAFIELRYLDGDQAHALAYAFHNLPKEIYGWGTWDVKIMRGRLEHYQSMYKHNRGFDYVKAFDAIFPPG